MIGHDETTGRWSFRRGEEIIYIDEGRGPQARRERTAKHNDRYRDLRDSVAEELGLPRSAVKVREGAGERVERNATTGDVTVTYKPGTPPAKAIETWKRQAHELGIEATSVASEIDTRRLTSGQEDIARWQADGIAGDPRAAKLLADPEFRLWFGRWMSQPERINAQGEIILPKGVPTKIAKKLASVKEHGNVVQTTKALEITERLAEKFPGLDLDPDSAGWKARREELAEEFGDAAIQKYEKDRGTNQRSAAEDSKINDRLRLAAGRTAMKELRTLVPDAELYVTGGAPRSDKPLGIPDLDIIVVVPDGTPHGIRVELEEHLGGRRIKIGERSDREVQLDPKVMTVGQFAGWSLSAPAKGINVRVSDTERAVAGRAGADLHDHVMGVPDTEYYVQKVGGGSAVTTLDRAWQLANDTSLTKDGVEAVQPTVKGILAEAVDDIARAKAEGQPDRVLEARARRALDAVLSANDRVPFDHTYDLRDYLVTAAGGIGTEQFATDVIAMQAERGTELAEQSVSIGKLEKMLDPATMEKAHAQAREAGADMDLRFLAMLPTGTVLSAGEHAGSIAPMLERVKTQLARKDVAGIDIAGPESELFTEAGMKNFEAVYGMVKAAAVERGRPLVLRPHVGEGYDPAGLGEHAAVAAQNLEMLVGTLERLGYQAGGDVIIRFGHAAHATPALLARIKALGIIVESNVGSNLATGAIARPEDHPLLYNAYIGVDTVLATDGEGVMGTDLQAEHRRAAMMFADFRDGRIALEVDGKALHYAEIEDAATRQRFSTEWLDQQMQHYRDAVAAGDALDKER